MPSTKRPPAAVPPPKGFRVDRTAKVGRHPLLEVFPGLDTLPTAARQEPTAEGRRALYGGSWIEVVDQDMWMYVAPWGRLKTIRRSRFSPVVTPNVDCIVVGQGHLRESPELMLFMDIYHELCHIQQRHRGEELFDRPEGYVQRPTELEAYRFVIGEARSLGVGDEFLRDYLKVEWISAEDYGELLDRMGVPRG